MRIDLLLAFIRNKATYSSIFQIFRGHGAAQIKPSERNTTAQSTCLSTWYLMLMESAARLAAGTGCLFIGKGDQRKQGATDTEKGNRERKNEIESY